MDPDKFSEKFLDGAYTLHSRGHGIVDWGMFGDSKRDAIRTTGVIIDTEVVVPTHIRAEATPFLYILVEGFGRLRGPVPLGRPPPLPWTGRTN